MKKSYKFKVFGRDQICASCVGAPGSKDTYEWLQAALNRKYGEDQFSYEYIDMDEAQANAKDQALIEQMEEEDWLFPLILFDDEVVAEGVPQLKKIYRALEAHGFA